MKILIENFRCYREMVEYEFSPGLILIKGPSGIGKSTIFEAISWVLYGNPRNVLPYTTLSKNERTHVRLQIEDLVVERWKKPELLQVTDTGNTLVDDPAQQVIIKKFGPLNVWKSCSYLSQGDRNSLISTSLAERFEILEFLAFGTQENLLDEYYSKIDMKIAELNTRYKDMIKEVDSLRNDMTVKGIFSLLEKIKDSPLVDQIGENLMKEKQELESEETLIQNNKIRRETLERQLQISLKDLSSIQPVTDSDIINISDRIKKLQSDLQYSSIIQKIKVLESQLSKYGNIVVPIMENLRKEDIKTAEDQEIQYLKFTQVCSKFGISKERFREYRKEIQDILNIKDQIIIKRTINIQTSKLPIVNVDDNINKLRKSISELEKVNAEAKRSLDVLTCPSCKTHLRYFSGKLNLSNESPVDINKISEYEETIKDLRKVEQMVCQREDILRTIESLKGQLRIPLNDIPDMTEVEIKQLMDKLTCLNSVSVCDPPPVSSFKIREQLQRQEEFQKYEEIKRSIELLKKDVPENLGDISSMETEFNTLNQKKTQITKLKENHILLSKTVKDLQVEIEKIPDKVSLRSKIENVKDRLRAFEMCKDALVQEGKLNDKTRLMNQIANDMTNFTEIRKIVSEVEHEKLNSVVLGINFWLGEICPQLFEDPISVRLDLFKTGKTTGRSRPNVHLSIIYKETEIDTLSGMSGGEGDRLSLALTLALNKISNCSFLLLDESMNSLDLTSKDLCCNVIRSICNSGNVLNILHDGTEGIFDNCLRIRK